MSKNFHWMKPYGRIREGIVRDSIVAFGKHPYKYEYLKETEDGDGKNYPTTTQWSYQLVIDLWWLKLRFNWLGRER